MDVGMDMIIMPAMQHWTAWDLVLVLLLLLEKPVAICRRTPRLFRSADRALACWFDLDWPSKRLGGKAAWTWQRHSALIRNFSR